MQNGDLPGTQTRRFRLNASLIETCASVSKTEPYVQKGRCMEFSIVHVTRTRDMRKLKHCILQRLFHHQLIPPRLH